MAETGPEQSNSVYLQCCSSACCSLSLCLSIFLQSFIIRIIIYYSVGAAVSKLLAHTPPITLFRQKHKRRTSWIRGKSCWAPSVSDASCEHSPVSSVRLASASFVTVALAVCLCGACWCSSSTPAHIRQSLEWDGSVPSWLDLNPIGVVLRVPQAALTLNNILSVGWKVCRCPLVTCCSLHPWGGNTHFLLSVWLTAWAHEVPWSIWVCGLFMVKQLWDVLGLT